MRPRLIATVPLRCGRIAGAGRLQRRFSAGGLHRAPATGAHLGSSHGDHAVPLYHPGDVVSGGAGRGNRTLALLAANSNLIQKADGDNAGKERQRTDADGVQRVSICDKVATRYASAITDGPL